MQTNEQPDFEGLREEVDRLISRLPEETDSPAELLCLGADYDNSPTDLGEWPDI
jgi:hypothetical protein